MVCNYNSFIGIKIIKENSKWKDITSFNLKVINLVSVFKLVLKI